MRFFVAAPVLAASGLLAFTACSTSHHGMAPSPTTTSTTRRASCKAAAVLRGDLARAHRDITRMRRIAGAAHPAQPELSRLTDRFLLDVAYLGPYSRNRLIDHAAAAASAGGCHDCFEALEAARPIPALKYSTPTCS